MFARPRLISRESINELSSPRIVDLYNAQCEELERITNPSGEGQTANASPEEVSLYYPWLNTVVNCVGADDHFMLRTNRNRELISIEEQQKLRQVTVGVAGMSVGSGIALALSYSGIAETIKIADNDVLDTSNLNRLRESLVNVGRPKVELTAEKIYEIDPFANVALYENGVTLENIDDFFAGLDLVIDEIDDFKMKVQLRLHAQKHKIPLLMFTSLGDNILVDVERYDIDPKQQIFNGLLGGVSEEILAKTEMTQEDIKKYSVQLVGPQYIPTKALKSVIEMGKTLVGRPQLYSTIAIDGGLAAYAVRQIILNDEPKAGRYFVKFADLLGVNTDELASTKEREDVFNQLRGQ